MTASASPDDLDELLAAARVGHVEARFDLGNKSAAQRNEAAEDSLGRIFVRRGGLANLVRGFAYFCEAVIDGHEPATRWRDDILGKVSPEQRRSLESVRAKIESGIRVVKVTRSGPEPDTEA